MGFLVAILLIFGVYAFVKQVRGKKLPPEAQEFGGRLGRSIHGAIPLPGLMGQPPASMMPEPAPDEVGPESNHIVVIKGNDKRPGDPKEDASRSSDLAEVRARLDAILPVDRPRPQGPRPPRRPRRGPPEG